MPIPGIEVSVFGMISNCCSMAFSNALIWLSSARIAAMETDMTRLIESFTVWGKRKELLAAA